MSIADDSALACARNGSAGKSKPPAVAPISRAASRLRHILLSFRPKWRNLWLMPYEKLEIVFDFARDHNAQPGYSAVLSKSPPELRLQQAQGPQGLLAEKSAKPLRILILGGTGFTGPFKFGMRSVADTR